MTSFILKTLPQNKKKGFVQIKVTKIPEHCFFHDTSIDTKPTHN